MVKKKKNPEPVDANAQAWAAGWQARNQGWPITDNPHTDAEMPDGGATEDEDPR